VTDIEHILSFWMEPRPETAEQLSARWKYWFWSGGEDVDRDIRERFGALVERARRGELDDWTVTANGTLALIILIDQFSRNIYRGTPEAFSADDRALRIAMDGYATGRFAGFDVNENMFASMPFRHAENLEAQQRCVAIAVQDATRGKPEWKGMLVDNVDWARKHLDVVARFGRFPHRNAAIGRPSTPEEIEYLAYLKHAGQWL
jgi:uncharacterized protein (DUF924 family)